MKLTAAGLQQALISAADEIENQKDALTDLDREIGDGDHGINMARGFQAVRQEMEAQENTEDLGELSKAAGKTLIGSVGGASGPLFGTAFIKFASSWAGKSEVEKEDLQKGFKEAVEGIKMRGKAEKGQKTMIDIWEPFADALAGSEDLEKVINNALEASKELQAAKGRASYFGEATKGLHDPGALSSAILLKQIAGVLNG